jgi:hypothetical protein
MPDKLYLFNDPFNDLTHIVFGDRPFIGLQNLFDSAAFIAEVFE